MAEAAADATQTKQDGTPANDASATNATDAVQPTEEMATDETLAEGSAKPEGDAASSATDVPESDSKVVDEPDEKSAEPAEPGAAAKPEGPERPIEPAPASKAAEKASEPAPAADAAPAKERRGAGHWALSALGVVLCLVLAPILAINVTLIVRSFMSPDEVPTVGGAFPMIVLTDSMYPEIHSGDLIIGRSVDPAELAEGDIVSFTDPDGDGVSVVTHRIVSIEQTDEGTVLHTQGDANNTEDPTPVPVDKVIGRYQMRIPSLGHVVMFMQTTPGFVLCVALPAAALVAYDVIRRRMWEKRQTSETDELLRELEELRARQADQGDA